MHSLGLIATEISLGLESGAFGALGAIGAFGALGALCALGALGSLGALGALVPPPQCLHCICALKLLLVAWYGWFYV